ncbi:MAG TPA: DUF362 domain-containing protein [Desulfomonilia bacterium]|jgi:uncharacterized protein (DUF362 family)
MNRREFIKTAVISGAATLIYPGLRNLAAAQSQYPDIAVVKGHDPARITLSAVNALGGMKRFVSRGDIVVVKPNIGWNRAPEFAANTNPFVVGAVVRMCLDAGAGRVKVFDNTCDNAINCYTASGIAAEAKRCGAEVIYMEDRKYIEVDIKGTALKKWPIYKDALDADKIINVPVAKDHGISRLTLSMKNMMGVMGGRRGKLHRKMGENLVDMARFMRPALTILDAVRILTANGPTGGNLKDVRKLDTVVAGTDMVAIDSYGATLFGMKGADLDYVKLGDAVRIGRMDIENLNIKKMQV